MNESFFGYDGPFFSVLNRIADLIILNVLWIICCIPVVTIGASTTAMLYVTMKILRGEDAYIVKNFFKAFKENFVQSTIMWLIMVVIAAIVVSNFLFLPNMKLSDTMYNMFFSAAALTALIFSMILMYLFPLQARLENKIKDTFKNAVLLSFRHLPTTIALLLLVYVPLVLAWFTFAQLFFVWFLIAGSGIAMICSLLYNRIFDIYIKSDEDKKDADQWEVEEEMKELPDMGNDQ